MYETLHENEMCKIDKSAQINSCKVAKNIKYSCKIRVKVLTESRGGG